MDGGCTKHRVDFFILFFSRAIIALKEPIFGLSGIHQNHARAES